MSSSIFSVLLAHDVPFANVIDLSCIAFVNPRARATLRRLNVLYICRWIVTIAL
jgi:hypothetical protein